MCPIQGVWQEKTLGQGTAGLLGSNTAHPKGAWCEGGGVRLGPRHISIFVSLLETSERNCILFEQQYIDEDAEAS